MKHDEQIDALIAAGDKATQGDWSRDERELYGLYNGTMQMLAATFLELGQCPKTKEADNNANFITQAANSREAIKALVKERDAYREALKLCVFSLYSIETLKTKTVGGCEKAETIKYMREIAREKIKDIERTLKKGGDA